MSSYAKERISNPSRYFETPDHVLNDDKLSHFEKEEVLRSMADDAEQMLEATSEGMDGGNPAFKAKDLQSALKKLKVISELASEDGLMRQGAHFQRIVVVTTVNQDLNREVANVAFDLAEIVKGKVTLLSVVPPAVEAAGYVAPGSMGAVVPPPTDDSQIIKDREDLLRKLKAESGAGIDTEIEVRCGHIEQTIMEYASDSDADVIVVGSPNRSWLEKLFEPSTARSVTKIASCPVLVVPDPS